MSLVVGKATKDCVILVSDTKLSIENKKLHPYLDGIAKILILNDLCAIAFAGTCEHAESIVATLNEKDTTDQIISKLSDGTHDKSFDAEFLVAVGGETPQLIKIAGGTSERRGSAWIGDPDGFPLYQRFFHTYDARNELYKETVSMKILQMPEGCAEENGKLYSQMYSALEAVCNSQKVKSVGGLVLPVILHKGKFTFGSYVSLFRCPVTDEVLNANNGVVPFGDAATGTYSVNLWGGQSYAAIHIAQANLGIIFCRSNSKFLKPERVANIDEIDFAKIISDRFDGAVGVTMHHNSANYFIKADNSFQSQRYEEALNLVTEGLRVSSRSWKGDRERSDVLYDSLAMCLAAEGSPLQIDEVEAKNLHYAFWLRGFCRCNLRQYELGLQDFIESLSLDNRYFPSMIARAKVLRELGRISEAISAAVECCNNHSEYEAFDFCGKLLNESGLNEAASEYLLKAQQILS